MCLILHIVLIATVLKKSRFPKKHISLHYIYLTTKHYDHVTTQERIMSVKRLLLAHYAASVFHLQTTGKCLFGNYINPSELFIL